MGHCIRFKIPLFLHRYAAWNFEGFQPNASAEIIKKSAGDLFNMLKDGENFLVKMGRADAFDREEWLEHCRASGIQLCTPFQMQPNTYDCIIAAIKGKFVVLLIQFVVDKENMALQVSGKFAERNLLLSFKE